MVSDYLIIWTNAPIIAYQKFNQSNDQFILDKMFMYFSQWPAIPTEINKIDRAAMIYEPVYPRFWISNTPDSIHT